MYQPTTYRQSAVSQLASPVLLGFVVCKRISYTETMFLSDELGTERTTDVSKAWVYGAVSDAQWAALTQTSNGWTLEAVYQEW